MSTRLLDCWPYLRLRYVLWSVSPDEQWKLLKSADNCQIAIGGSTRAESVRAGLECLSASDDELVLVHDAVRPLVALDDIKKLIRVAAESESGALLATPVIDTLKLSDDSQSVVSTPDRSTYWHAQTPQAFSAGLLRRALDRALDRTGAVTQVVTDEASAVEALGLKPKLVEGSRDNIKITTVEDLALAEFLLQPGNNLCE